MGTGILPFTFLMSETVWKQIFRYKYPPLSNQN
jgi:hypothetical protein